MILVKIWSTSELKSRVRHLIMSWAIFLVSLSGLVKTEGVVDVSLFGGTIPYHSNLCLLRLASSEGCRLNWSMMSCRTSRNILRATCSEILPLSDARNSPVMNAAAISVEPAFFFTQGSTLSVSACLVTMGGDSLVV